MPTQELDQLTPTFLALPAVDVNPPGGMPIATFLAEAETLGLLVADPKVAPRLKKVGVSDERLAIFPVAVLAARQAQAVWTRVRGRQSTETFEETMERGQNLRRRMLKSCGWNLRRNRKVQATLDLIREGDSTPDLAQDLHDLAGLVENNEPAFVKDQTFDAPAVAAEAREVSGKLMGGKSAYYHSFNKTQAKDLRDRAFTFLNDLVDEMRHAGTYAFDDDADMVTRFTSGYWRQYNHPSALPVEPVEPPVEPQESAEPAPVQDAEPALSDD
jgi:hypothetical protein